MTTHLDICNELQEAPGYPGSYCPCTNSNHEQPITIIHIPFYIASDYFCETGVPSGQTWRYSFYIDDPLWDGQGCGSTSTCCTFNTPPWFCKQLPQSTSADLEVRLCSYNSPVHENTPVELIEIYIR